MAATANAWRRAGRRRRLSRVRASLKRRATSRAPLSRLLPRSGGSGKREANGISVEAAWRRHPALGDTR
jgi:hypothetical protein